MNDYETFQKRLPHELIPTNIPGAFASPAPAEEFDPNTASHTSLIKNGFFWKRPQEGDDPRLIAAWEKAFSRRWLAKDRIIPHLEPQIGKTHFLRELKKADAGFTNNRWSGGIFSGPGQWSGVTAQWTVPTVSQPIEPPGLEGGWNSSSWIGIDGRFSNDVLQAGVEQRVDSHGNATYTAWYEWFCPFKKLPLKQISDSSPALTSLNGNLYIAWKGEDGRGLLNIMVSTDDGLSFVNRFVSSEISSQPPSLIAHNGQLYIAWRGDDGQGLLNIARVDIAGNTITGLSAKVTLNEITSANPALASLNGNLYIAWKGEDGRGFLNVMVSTDDGHTFGNKFISSEISSQAPALTVHNGQLYIAWRGDDGKGFLNIARVDTTGNTILGFSEKVTLSEISDASPALASLNQILYIGWRGNDGKGFLNVMATADGGHTFGTKFISSDITSQAPVLTVHNNLLRMGWTGIDGKGHLNVATIDTEGLTIIGFAPPPVYIYQTNIPNFTVNPGDTIHCSVQYIAGQTAGQISFANNTTGQNFSLTLAPPPGATFSGNCIEWIMEAPDGGLPTSALPSFTPVVFTSAVGCSLARKALGDPQNGDFVNIVNGLQTLTAVTLGSDTVTIDFIG